MRSLILRTLLLALAACAHHHDVTQDANGNCDPADPTCIPVDACADCTDVHTFATASLIIPMERDRTVAMCPRVANVQRSRAPVGELLCGSAWSCAC